MKIDVKTKPITVCRARMEGSICLIYKYAGTTFWLCRDVLSLVSHSSSAILAIISQCQSRRKSKNGSTTLQSQNAVQVCLPT